MAYPIGRTTKSKKNIPWIIPYSRISTVFQRLGAQSDRHGSPHGHLFEMPLKPMPQSK
jgi:hypothetical protein